MKEEVRTKPFHWIEAELEILVTSGEPLAYRLLADRLLEYVAESNHQGWEGFSRRDLTGVRRFLEDFITFVKFYEEAPKEKEKKV